MARTRITTRTEQRWEGRIVAVAVALAPPPLVALPSKYYHQLQSEAVVGRKDGTDPRSAASNAAVNLVPCFSPLKHFHCDTYLKLNISGHPYPSEPIIPPQIYRPVVIL